MTAETTLVGLSAGKLARETTAVGREITGMRKQFAGRRATSGKNYRRRAVSKKAHRGQWVPVRNDLLLFLYRVLDTMLNYINQRHSRLKPCV